eukprot:1157920-Pelagomonas_calceolata.AAC.4
MGGVCGKCVMGEGCRKCMMGDGCRMCVMSGVCGECRPVCAWINPLAWDWGTLPIRSCADRTQASGPKSVRHGLQAHQHDSLPTSLLIRIAGQLTLTREHCHFLVQERFAMDHQRIPPCACTQVRGARDWLHVQHRVQQEDCHLWLCLQEGHRGHPRDACHRRVQGPCARQCQGMPAYGGKGSPRYTCLAKVCMLMGARVLCATMPRYACIWGLESGVRLFCPKQDLIQMSESAVLFSKCLSQCRQESVHFLTAHCCCVRPQGHLGADIPGHVHPQV